MNTIQWNYTDKSLPLAYESGNWDGKRSDEVVAEDKNGKKYIARIYQGHLDGSEFLEWVDGNDDCINENITRWFDLPY